MPTLLRERSEAGVEQIDPRIAARREAVSRGRVRRRTRRLALVAIAATLVAAAYGLSRSALVDVDRVLVAGAVHTGEAAVVAAAGIAPGDQLLDVDPEAAAAAIEALPWVAHASVVRHWRSGDVAIRVEEREAVAQLPTEGAVAVADRHGRVLEYRPPSETALTVVRGVAPVAPGEQLAPTSVPALEIAATLPPGLRSRIAAVVVDGETIRLELRPAGTARLGRPEELAEKLRSLQTLLANIDLTGLCSIDLRVADSPVVDRRQPCA